MDDEAAEQTMMNMMMKDAADIMIITMIDTLRRYLSDTIN